MAEAASLKIIRAKSANGARQIATVKIRNNTGGENCKLSPVPMKGIPVGKTAFSSGGSVVEISYTGDVGGRLRGGWHTAGRLMNIAIQLTRSRWLTYISSPLFKTVRSAGSGIRLLVKEETGGPVRRCQAVDPNVCALKGCIGK